MRRSLTVGVVFALLAGSAMFKERERAKDGRCKKERRKKTQKTHPWREDM